MKGLVTAGQVLRFVWTHPANRGRRARALVQALAYQLKARRGEVVVAHLGRTSVIEVHRGSHSASSCVYANPPDYPEMTFWARVLRPGDLFVDVGANVGVYSVWAADLGAKVVALEPIPDAANQLVRNMHLNEYPVELHRVAAADSAGVGRITLDRGTMNSLTDSDSASSLEVRLVPLDEVIGDRVVRGIKIDVEGAEHLVMRGMRRALAEQRVDYIQLEWNERSLELLHEDRSPIASLLESYGYELARPTASGALVRTSDAAFGADMFARRPIDDDTRP